MVMCSRRSEHTVPTEVRFYLRLIVRCNSIDSFRSILGTFSALIVQNCQTKLKKDVLGHKRTEKVNLNKITMITGTVLGIKSIDLLIRSMFGKVRT